MIVIINGPCGIGKTSTAWALLDCFDRAVMLDGDYIGAVRPFEIYAEERVEYLYHLLRHLVSYHREHGNYQHYIINYVFETPETLTHLRDLLLEVTTEPIYTFRLLCAEAEMERRICAREHDADARAWYLRRFRELTAIQERAAQHGDVGYPIDVTHQTPAEAAAAIWTVLHEEVRLHPYDPGWETLYQTERAQVAAALGPLACAIHHVGSTAVPGLCAKPIIDLLVETPTLDAALRCIIPLQALGYVFVDHPDNRDRRFFRKGAPRTHHLHIVAAGSAAARDLLDFRNALRADPLARERYARHKEALAVRYRHQRPAYTEAKGELIAEILAQWRVRNEDSVCASS